jgi:hypothetical protein
MAMIARRGEMMLARGAEYEWECRLVVLLTEYHELAGKTERFIKANIRGGRCWCCWCCWGCK